jgi:DNA-binding beta-propeller fold protein YncE
MNASDADNGQVLLVDPQGLVHGRIITGNIPDMVLSPDGTRLYIASISQAGDILSVIETASGNTLQTIPVNGRWLYTIMPELSSMAISPDGHWLYMMMLRNNMDSVALFDTAKGGFLPDEESISYCIAGLLLTRPANHQLQVLCNGTNDVRFLQFPRDSHEATNILPPLTLLPAAGRRLKVSTATVSLKGNTYAIMGDGRIVEIDDSTGKIARRVVSTPLVNGYIPAREVLLSPDATKLYIAFASLSQKSSGQAEQILVIDTKSGKRLETITTSRPFWNLALSRDGNALYAISSTTQSLLVIDTSSYKEMRIIEKIGISPARAITTP